MQLFSLVLLAGLVVCEGKKEAGGGGGGKAGGPSEAERKALFEELQGAASQGDKGKSLPVQQMISSACTGVVVSDFSTFQEEAASDGCKWITFTPGAKLTIQLEKKAFIKSPKVIDGRGATVTMTRTDGEESEGLKIEKQSEGVVITGIIFQDIHKMAGKEQNWRTLTEACNKVTKYTKIANERCDVKGCEKWAASKSNDKKEREELTTKCKKMLDSATKICICDVDFWNEKDAIAITDSSNVWVHRNSFIRAGEAIQVNGAAGGGYVTISYNYFDSIYDAIPIERPGLYSVHHNTYRNCNRRQPKVHDPNEKAHVWNDVVIDIGSSLVYEGGHMYHESSYWEITKAPLTPSDKCEQEMKAVFVDTNWKLGAWSFDKSLCTKSPTDFRPTYSYTVESTNCAANEGVKPKPANMKCTTNPQWYKRYLPTSPPGVNTAGNGAGSKK